MLVKYVFWLRSTRVFSQCQSMIFFGRHQLGVFRLVLIVIIFWPMLVRVFVADIGKVFLWPMLIVDIFLPTSVETIFWLMLASFFLLMLVETIFLLANIGHDYFFWLVLARDIFC